MTSLLIGPHHPLHRIMNRHKIVVIDDTTVTIAGTRIKISELEARPATAELHPALVFGVTACRWHYTVTVMPRTIRIAVGLLRGTHEYRRELLEPSGYYEIVEVALETLVRDYTGT